VENKLIVNIQVKAMYIVSR